MKTNILSKLLSKDAILSADDIQTEIVEVPEWGGSVKVRTLSALEKGRWEQSGIVDDKVTVDFMKTGLVARSIVDDKGRRLFSDAEIGKLAAKSGAAIERVYEVAARLSQVGEHDVRDAVKNSAKIHGDDSTRK